MPKILDGEVEVLEGLETKALDDNLVPVRKPKPPKKKAKAKKPAKAVGVPAAAAPVKAEPVKAKAKAKPVEKSKAGKSKPAEKPLKKPAKASAKPAAERKPRSGPSNRQKLFEFLAKPAIVKEGATMSQLFEALKQKPGNGQLGIFLRGEQAVGRITYNEQDCAGRDTRFYRLTAKGLKALAKGPEAINDRSLQLVTRGRTGEDGHIYRARAGEKIQFADDVLKTK